MKKISGSWILFILVVVLSAYTYFFEFYKKDQDEKKKAEDTKIFTLSKDQISQLEIRNASGKTVLERTVDGWVVSEPLKDIADNEDVENFLGSLVDERTKDLVKEGDGSDDKAFGFGTESIFIGLKSSSGQSQEVEVSQQKNFEGNSFLRMKDQKKIYTGNPAWLNYAVKKADDFRDKRFLRARIAEASEIEIKNPAGEFKLISKDGKWQSSALATELLDQNRIRELLASLSDLKAQEILNSDHKERVTKPDVNIKLKIKVKGEDSVWTGRMALAQDKKTAVAENSFPGQTVKLDKIGFDRFREISLLSLRDRRWPFEFDKTKIKNIEYGSTAKKSKLKLTGADWALENSEANVEVQQVAVRDLIDRLKTFEATDFLPTSEAKNLKAENYIRLNDGDGKLVFEFLWGSSQKKKKGEIETTFRLAKTSRSNEVFSVEESTLTRLNLQGLTLTKKEKP